MRLLVSGQSVQVKASRAPGCGPEITIVVGDAVAAKFFLGLQGEEARRMAARLIEAADFIGRQEFYEEEV